MSNKAIIKLHVIFWIVISSISLLNTFLYIGNALFVPLLISAIMGMLCNIITFYLFYFLVSAGKLNRKGVIFLVLFGLFYLSAAGFVFTFILYLPVAYYYSPSDPLNYTLANGFDSIYQVTAYLTIVSILGSLWKVSLIWYRNQIKQKETEKQNISNELAMLRAQINPHFLFNTLNNIKSLVKSIPSKAVYSVDKLTGMMRYMLYESSLESVPLGNEIGHINNYIDLEKIRYSDPDFIDFKIYGDYKDIPVPPLVFMPFIENAFKHGNKLKPAPGIIIKIDVLKRDINFEIKNFMKENHEAHDKNSGFGLSNIRRRLDLLFDKKYDLVIDNKNKTFTVKLNLIIS
ncbi:MAG: histidine kinase [Ignavibacteria bacterium]|nr:histidine kinase [Ignavibacteria bacterium]